MAAASPIEISPELLNGRLAVVEALHFQTLRQLSLVDHPIPVHVHRGEHLGCRPLAALRSASRRRRRRLSSRRLERQDRQHNQRGPGQCPHADEQLGRHPVGWHRILVGRSDARRATEVSSLFTAPLTIRHHGPPMPRNPGVASHPPGPRACRSKRRIPKPAGSGHHSSRGFVPRAGKSTHCGD